MTKLYILLRYVKGRNKIHEIIGIFDSQERAETVMRNAFAGVNIDMEVRILNNWYTGEAYKKNKEAVKGRERYRGQRD